MRNSASAIIVLIGYTLGSFLSVLAALLQYPSLVLYYYVITIGNLYGNPAQTVLAIIQRAYIIICFYPLTLIAWKFLSVRNIKVGSFLSKSLRKYLRKYLISSLAVFLFAFSIGAALMLTLLYPVEEDVRAFVGGLQSTCSGNTTCIIKGVVQYVDAKIRWSYNNPMYVLEIDNMLSLIDYWLLSVFRFTQAHVILWQGWGSCGEHAVVTAYLLNRLGYTTRIARFGDIDHGWAEIYVNGSWYIVDPWYIGFVYENQYQGNKYLVPVAILSSLKDFSGNHKVLCSHLDSGIETDCSREHGY